MCAAEALVWRNGPLVTEQAALDGTYNVVDLGHPTLVYIWTARIRQVRIASAGTELSMCVDPIGTGTTSSRIDNCAGLVVRYVSSGLQAGNWTSPS